MSTIYGIYELSDNYVRPYINTSVEDLPNGISILYRNYSPTGIQIKPLGYAGPSPVKISGLQPATGYWISYNGDTSYGFYTYGAKANATSIGTKTSSSVQVSSSINKYGGAYATRWNNPPDGSVSKAPNEKMLVEHGFVYCLASDSNDPSTDDIKNKVSDTSPIYGFSSETPSPISSNISGLESNTEYYIRSYAIWNKDSTGTRETEYGPVTSFTTKAATDTSTAAPVLQGIAGDKACNLLWTSGNGGPYDVYRNGTKVGTAYGPSYNDTGLTNGSSYSYFVIDSKGKQSNAISLTPVSSYVPPPTVYTFVHNKISNSWMNGKYVIKAHTEATRGIWGNNVTVRVDEAVKEYPTLDIYKDYTYSFDPSTYSNGDHTIRITSTEMTTLATIDLTYIVNVNNLAKPSARVLSAIGSVGRVELSWNAFPSSEAVSKIYVERFNPLIMMWSTISTISNGTATSYTDMDVIADKTYIYRIRGVNASGDGINSNEASATPYILKIPDVITVSVNYANTTYSSITAVGNVSNNNHSPVITRGICYSAINPIPTIYDSIKSGTTDTNYSCVLNNLKRNTQYYVRAYATNGVGTGYGEVLTETTLTQLPTVSCEVKDFLPHDFTLVGKVTDDGANKVLSTGFYYSGAPDPVTTGFKVDTVANISYEFSKIYTNMIPDKTYYAVSFVNASNNMTAYSNVITFKTPPFPKLDTPLPPVAIDRTDVSMRWVCPTIGARLVITGYDGTFTSPSDLTNLIPDTVYSAYSYMPGDGVWTDDSLPSELIEARTRKPIPVKPQVAEIEQDYIIWICETPGAKVVCDAKTKEPGNKWNKLIPNTEYEAFSFQPGTTGWDNDSFPSEIVKVTTPKVKYAKPNNIVVEMVTPRTVKLSATVDAVYSDPLFPPVTLIYPVGNVVITCNGVTKPSGSIWTWLTPETEYLATAMINADDSHRASDITTATFTTLKAPISEPDLYVIGFMEDGARAPIKLLNNMKITSNNPDFVDIVGKSILVTQPGNVRITVDIEGVQTHTDITIV